MKNLLMCLLTVLLLLTGCETSKNPLYSEDVGVTYPDLAGIYKRHNYSKSADELNVIKKLNGKDAYELTEGSGDKRIFRLLKLGSYTFIDMEYNDGESYHFIWRCTFENGNLSVFSAKKEGQVARYEDYKNSLKMYDSKGLNPPGTDLEHTKIEPIAHSTLTTRELQSVMKEYADLFTDLDYVLTKTDSTTPPHVVVDPATKKLYPENGYKWVSTAENDTRVVWAPGKAHPTYAHIIAHQDETYWIPESGYKLKVPHDLSTAVWTPGLAHQKYEHIHSYSQEGKWMADAGYTFNDIHDISTARWTPGVQDPNWPHVFASKKEGTWHPESGYKWKYPDSKEDLSVRWTPGASDPSWPHVVASNTEGNWRPESGYKWKYPDSKNDYSVEPMLSNDAQQVLSRVIADIVVGGIANDYANQNPNTFSGAVAEEVHKQAVDDALQTIFK